ncbi:MAG: Amuc_1102 family pilus-like protein [Luteolibacter sp.]
MQRITPFFSIAIAAAFLLPQEVEAQAQMAARATVAQPAASTLQSPEIPSQTRQKRFTPRDWVEIEAAVKLETRPVPPSGMVDRLIVKWYIAISNPDKRGEYFLLSREVTHVNVPIDEEFFSSVYLSPSSVRRITGNFRNADKAVAMIGCEVLFNGEVIGVAANRGATDNWWSIASPKISASDSVPLLTKPETPFAAMWWDRYAEVAVEK